MIRKGNGKSACARGEENTRIWIPLLRKFLVQRGAGQWDEEPSWEIDFCKESQVVLAVVEEKMRYRVSSWKQIPSSLENHWLCSQWNLPHRLLRN